MFINCHSYYSFKYGTLSIEGLVSEAKSKKLDALALTDINSVSGVFPFIKEAQKNGIHPVIGIDFRNGVKQQYIGLAKNQEGFYELNLHLSQHKTKGIPFKEKAPSFQNSFIVYPFSEKVFTLRENEFIGVHPYQINKIGKSGWFRQKEKLVLLQPATFSSKIEFNAHRLLRAIDGNTLLSKLDVAEQGNICDMLYS
jgi:DNA polymerase-3 subunit alpha